MEKAEVRRDMGEVRATVEALWGRKLIFKEVDENLFQAQEVPELSLRMGDWPDEPLWWILWSGEAVAQMESAPGNWFIEGVAGTGIE